MTDDKRGTCIKTIPLDCFRLSLYRRRNLDTTWNKWSVNRILSGQFIVIDKNTNLPGTFVTSHKQSQDVVDCPPGINEDDDDDGPPPTRDDKR